MKRQLIVCFSVLVAIIVFWAVLLLTVEPDSAKEEIVCSDYTEDSAATQVRQPALKDTGNHSGYVLAHYHYDQQTVGLKNLFSLQCWAAQLNMPVVEPFVVKSAFQTPLGKDVRDLLRFSDLYDMGQWNEAFVKPNSFLPFASWEDFVANSPRDVILVQTLDSRSTCSFSKMKQLYACFFRKHHFRIVREVCIHVDKNKSMTTDEFNHLVLNEYYKIRKVSVIFWSWRGVCVSKDCVSHIIRIADSKCDRRTLLNPNTLNASKRVNQDADLYVHRHLKNRSYISVMLRFEKAIKRKGVSARTTNNIVSNCTKGVRDTWKRLKKENQLYVTFLTWDLGRFGSAFFKINDSRWNITQKAQSLFTAIYGNSTSVEDWENTFVELSGSTNPGYIALLQMSIAARARCIMLIGGGTFQRRALQMYKDLHPQNQCIN